MKKFRIIVLVLLMFQYLVSYSQTDSTDYFSSSYPAGIPLSFGTNDIFVDRSSSNALSLPALNNEELKAQMNSMQQNCTQCQQTKYYGTGIRNTIDLKSNAQYYNSSVNNGKLWILKINSPTALGFQIYFSTFHLPDEASLHIYTADSIIQGPFTSVNNPRDSTKQIQFGTMPIMGNEIYLEYFESDSADFTGSIVIDNIIHIFDYPFTDPTRDASASCQRDAACIAGWGREINSVARIVMYDSNLGLAGWSTGTLLNNTRQDGIPYFLTAAHVFKNTFSIYDLSTWLFQFDYENLTCLPSFAGLDPIPRQVVYGASEILAQDALNASGNSVNSDYLLIRLNTTASDLFNMGVCYSGWSRFSPLSQFGFSDSDEFTFIHHPNGDVKKISIGDFLRQSSNFGTWSPTNVYNLNIKNSSTALFGGAIEFGSSGCPLYNINHKIIGTSSGFSTLVDALTGDPIEYDPCDPATYGRQFFGRFDRHWSLGNFKQWLDPLNLTDANPNYDGPSTYCPNPTAQVIEPPVINTVQTLNEGIRINRKSADVPILCQTDNNNILTVTPLVASAFAMNTYNRGEKCKDNPGVGCVEETNFLGFKTGHCHCLVYAYQIYINELDYNFNPVGASGTKAYEAYAGSQGSYIKAIYINVPDVLGHSLEPGKFYNIGVGSLQNGKWFYSSRTIYILPNSIIISNNSNVNSNVYAIDEITIQNSMVSNNVNFVASNKITILPNSTLHAGEYFIEDVNCGLFGGMIVSSQNDTGNGKADIIVNNSVDIQNYQRDIEYYESLTAVNNNITILPNPNNGSFQITINKNESVITQEIKVYDVMGKVIWSSGISSNNQFNVDISSYSKGIYYVRLINEIGETEIRKLVKQ